MGRLTRSVPLLAAAAIALLPCPAFALKFAQTLREARIISKRTGKPICAIFVTESSRYWRYSRYYSGSARDRMLNSPEVATSSGSACSANYPEPSHVLRALGLDDDVVRSSLRFGLGRFNTADEISRSVEILSHTVRQLRQLGPLDA